MSGVMQTKSLLAGHPNTKQPSRNSAVSNTSGQEQLDLFDVNGFHTSVSQCPKHCSPAGNSDMHNTVVHVNV
jgi:hypothetical protein